MEGSQKPYLTIERELQQYGEELFQNKRGGIVAIEPKTGEVLALVSAPSYDPNIPVEETIQKFSKTGVGYH